VVRRVVVPPVYQGLKRNILSVGGDVPVDSEASVVTSSISRPDLLAQSFGGAHRGRMYVCAFIGAWKYTVCVLLSQ
jgi:hypothetical protein